MSNVHSSFSLLLLLVFTTEGALYGHYVARCQFNPHDGHDAVYLEEFSFNKELLMQYNSTRRTVIGYTQEAIKETDILNKDTTFLLFQEIKTWHCRSGAMKAYKGLLNPVEPYIKVRKSSKHPGILTCSVYKFYPKQIKVTWLRDGKEMTSGVTSTDEMSNGNWLYQIHSHLEYKPRHGEKITCMVEHASFKQPKLVDWDPMPDPGIYKIVVGIIGLVLGVLLSVAGIIYYKKRSTVMVPEQLLQPEEPVVQESVTFLPVSETS